MSQDHNHLNHDARPRAHADIDPTEIFGGGGDRVYEAEKLDLDRAEWECTPCVVSADARGCDLGSCLRRLRPLSILEEQSSSPRPDRFAAQALRDCANEAIAVL